MGRPDYRYPPSYAKLPYNSICVGNNCDARFTRGDFREYLKISLCDKCFKSYRANPKNKRQRMEAECNAVVQAVYDRLKEELWQQSQRL